MRGTRPTTRLSCGPEPADRERLGGRAARPGAARATDRQPERWPQCWASACLARAGPSPFESRGAPPGGCACEITSYEGLRGSFVVHPIGWYVLLVPAISLTASRGAAAARDAAPGGAPVGLGGCGAGRAARHRRPAGHDLWARAGLRWMTRGSCGCGAGAAMRRCAWPSSRRCAAMSCKRAGRSSPRGWSARAARAGLRHVVFALDQIASRDYRTRVPAGCARRLSPGCLRARRAHGALARTARQRLGRDPTEG